MLEQDQIWESFVYGRQEAQEGDVLTHAQTPERRKG